MSRQENVEFYDVESALAAGYRPCLRCRPGCPAGTPADEAVRRSIEFLEEHLDESVTLKRLGRHVSMSPHHLQRTFKERVGVSPKSYQDARRVERFRGIVQNGRTVSRATYEAGFNSSRSLYDQARARLGMTPGRYRKGGQGLHIRFPIVTSTWGPLIVAATAKGVCAVSIADDKDTLVHELREEFPRASLERSDKEFRAWAAAVAEHADTSSQGTAIPADLEKTVFQMRVWQALQELLPG